MEKLRKSDIWERKTRKGEYRREGWRQKSLLESFRISEAKKWNSLKSEMGKNIRG